MPSTPLTLGVLSPGAISFTFSFSLSLCLVSISSGLASHDPVSPGTAKPLVGSLLGSPVLSSLFGVCLSRFWQRFPSRILCQILDPGLSIYRERESELPWGRRGGSCNRKGVSLSLQPFGNNCPQPVLNYHQLLLSLPVLYPETKAKTFN